MSWLLDKAQASGLQFKQRLPLTGNEYLADPVDSYGRFLKGAYRVLTLNRRHFRPIGSGPTPTKGGDLSCPVNETIDASVFKHWNAKPQYRPKNLSDWAKRRGKNLATLTGDQPAA